MSYSLLCENQLNLKQNELGLRCGEIYLNKNEQNKITLSCICEQLFLSLETFTKHILNEHFAENSKSERNLKNNLKHEQDITSKYNFEVAENGVKEYFFENLRSSTVLKQIEQDEEITVKVDLNKEDVNIKYKISENKLKQIENLKKKKIPNGYFKCSLCSDFFRKEEKDDHLKKHKYTKRFICETCGKGCKDKYQLIQHIKNHTGERPFQCQFCLATFKLKHTLRGHERTHLDYRPFKCSICNAFFKSKRNVQQHELRHSTPLERNFECDLCGKKFNTNNKMLDHRGRHKEETKPFQCSKCPKGFQSKYACTAHERLEHKGEYNYKCNFCDKLFIKIAMKKAHEATHTRVGQPFLCNVCPKKYATREGLYKHKKREHILDKPIPDLKCHKCNIVLKMQSEYAEHCRKHVLEEYQFICPDCGASFVNEIKLKNHINIIHEFNDKNR